jgi:hypothetical protein
MVRIAYICKPAALTIGKLSLCSGSLAVHLEPAVEPIASLDVELTMRIEILVRGRSLET